MSVWSSPEAEERDRVRALTRCMGPRRQGPPCPVPARWVEIQDPGDWGPPWRACDAHKCEGDVPIDLAGQ